MKVGAFIVFTTLVSLSFTSRATAQVCYEQSRI